MCAVRQAVAVLLLPALAAGRVINGDETGPNICSSWDTRCNGDAGWIGWCDDGWDHHCCFREGPPPEGQGQCTEPEKCHFICCDWPEKPCGYKCCSPEGEVSAEADIAPIEKPPLPTTTTVARDQEEASGAATADDLVV